MAGTTTSQNLVVKVVSADHCIPSKFFVRTEAMEAEFNALDDLLEETYRVGLSQNGGKVLNGLLVVKRGRRYFRAKLLGTIEPKEEDNGLTKFGQARVYLFDIGVEDVVPFGVLKPILEEFAEKPALCWPCHLANLRPVGEEWSEEAIEYFQQAVGGRRLSLLRRGDIKMDSKGTEGCWPFLPVELSWEDVAVDGPFGRQRESLVHSRIS